MGILSELWPYILVVVVAAAGAMGLRAAGKKAGREEVLHQQERDAAKMRDKARGISNEVDSMDDDAVRDRASSWVRGREGR